MDKLTPKRQRFVDEYLVDLNGTQAAIRAGYSQKTACEQATRLLANVQVQAAIHEAVKKQQQRTQITADAVLAEYAKIAFSNISDFADFGYDRVILKSSSTIKLHVLAAVESVSETKDGVKIKLHSKLSALDSLAKHLGIDKPNVNEDDKPDINNFVDALQVSANDIDWSEELADGDE